MIIDPLGIVPIERGGTGATTAEEAKEKLGIVSGGEVTVLYSNTSGTTGTITLSDSIQNYKSIGIYFYFETVSNRASSRLCRFRRSYTSTNQFKLENTRIGKGTNGVSSNIINVWYEATDTTMSISRKTILVVDHSDLAITSAGSSSDNLFYVTHVFGYKNEY